MKKMITIFVTVLACLSISHSALSHSTTEDFRILIDFINGDYQEMQCVSLDNKKSCLSESCCQWDLSEKRCFADREKMKILAEGLIGYTFMFMTFGILYSISIQRWLMYLFYEKSIDHRYQGLINRCFRNLCIKMATPAAG